MKKYTSLLLIAGYLLSAAPVSAQTTIQISRATEVGVSSVNRLLSAGFTVAVVLAVVFVFGMLIMGGYAWITAGGDKAKVEEARTRITNALIGLAIVASAFALIAIIGNFFGVSISNIHLPSAAGPGTTSGDPDPNSGGGLLE